MPREIIRRDYAPHLPPQLRQALLESLDREPPQIAANEAIRTDRAVYPGAAIIGDAGGCSHPLTATGMTVGSRMRSAWRGSWPQPEDSPMRRRWMQLRRRRALPLVRARELWSMRCTRSVPGRGPGTRAIREGIFRYRQGSTDGAGAIDGAASGAESRPSCSGRIFNQNRTSTSAVLRG